MVKTGLKDSLLQLLTALAIGLVVSSCFILFAGENPITAYGAMGKGAFVGKLNILSTLRWSVPYILAGVAAAVAIRADLFNMGLEGCIYLGGLASALAGAYLPSLPPVLHVTICMLAGSLVGALWLLIPAWLKAKHGINEVIMTWMLTYIAVLLGQFLATIFQQPEDITSAVQQVRTPEIAASAQLPQLVPPYQLNAGIFIVVVICILYYLFCRKSKLGFEQRAVGLAPHYAKYAGIHVHKVQFYSLLVSGALGGLCGSLEVLGVHYRYIQGFAQDMGANGIMVSLMGGLSPVGVPLAGLFMGAVQNGARAMSRNTNVSLDTARILISVIVICITAQGLYKYIKIKKHAGGGK